MPLPDDVAAALPNELAEIALERMLQAAPVERGRIAEELAREHPSHAEALRLVAADLAAADRLLEGIAVLPPSPPAQIGPYRVLRRLGEGAFGVVYLCEQAQPVQRSVAVKVLRADVGDERTLARFANERQLLASLDHPAIARVLDAGSLEDGRPYFAMEHVDGEPLLTYCDAHKLAVLDRLSLFLEICRGVQHAHAHGVVHRDLKPANLLVVEREGRHVPRIIDFGIAKVIGPHGALRHLQTEPGRVVGTPGYMSPEQARGDSATVDVRSDVFSLGVMLYELLTGALPWPPRDAQRDSDAPRPSARVTSDPAQRDAIAAHRATDPRRLQQRLRGELDWIVLKALQLAPHLRYPTVQDLILDLERHQRGEPVQAGPPAMAYRLRKLARRHRGKLVAALVLALAGLALWRLLDLERAVERTSSMRLDELSSAVERLRERAQDPRLSDLPESDDLRRGLLEAALELLEPVLRARAEGVAERWRHVRVLDALGEQLFYLARYRESIELSRVELGEALALSELEPESVELKRYVARAKRSLGRNEILLDRSAEALPWCEDAVAELEALHADDPAAHAKLLSKCLVELGSARHITGDSDGEIAAQRHAIEVLQAYLARQPGDAEAERDLVRFHCGLAGQISRTDLEQAIATALEARRLEGALAGVTEDEQGIVARRLALLYEYAGRDREAAEELARCVPMLERMLQRHPRRHSERAVLRDLLATRCEIEARLGHADAALEQGRAAVAAGEGLPSDHPRRDLGLTRVSLRVARAVASHGSRESAEHAASFAASCLEAAPRSGVPSLPVEARILEGHLLAQLGRPWSAATWSEVAAEAQAIDAPALAVQAHTYAAHQLLAEGRLGDAQALFDQLEATYSADPLHFGVQIGELVRLGYNLALECGDEDELLRLAESAYERREDWGALQTAADGFALAAELASSRGASARVADAAARAELAYQELIVALGPELDPSRGPVPRLCRAQAELHLAELAGDPARASELRERSLPELDELRETVPATWWDEGLWLRAHLQRLRDEVASASAAETFRALTALDERAVVARDLVALSRLFALCARRARDEGAAATASLEHDARASALRCLERAIDAGYKDRARLLECEDLRDLRSDPHFRELLDRLGD